MKKITLFKFLGFSSSDNCVVSRRENGFKLDFSKVTSVEECCSETKKKPKGVMGILVLLMLFLFSNISTAQITLDGDPNDWGTLLSTPGGIKARITDPIDGTDDIWTLGSKDVQQISQWAWTTNSSNDKNNMANVGYYFDGTFLYFFADRRANNGDSAIGFWILQDSVGKLGVTSGGFSGQHIDGDILMISHFVNGGAVADINAYRWTNGALDPTPIPLPTSGLDARVNVNTVNSPPSWNYVPKFGAAGTYPPSSFFEGYIDLSSVNFNLSVCLGTFLAETRNSQSLTASLEDLARGRFGSVPAPKTLVGSSFCSSSPNSGTITLANSETQVSYQLKKDSDDTNVQVAQLGTGGTLTWSNLPAGNYYVVATNTISECTTLIGRPTAVTVVQSPTVSVNSPSKCSNDPAVSITATVNPAGTYTYVWTVPQGASNPGNVASFNATVGGSYSVVVTNGSTNCSGSGSGTLTVNPSPNLVTNNPAPVCAPLTVDLTLPAVTTGSNLQGGTLTYWTNSGATTPLNNPSAVSASGTYYIKVTTSANCTDIKPVTVTIIPVIPIVINCPQNSSTSACAYADQAAVNAAFATWLGGFTASGGNGTLVTSGLQNLSAPNLCAGGNVTVNFSASDGCGKQATCSATFTITAAPQVTVNAPAASSTSACAYADQAAVNAAFATWLGGFTVSGGCNPQGSYGEVSAPNACGGTTTVTYTVMDKCYQTTTVTRAFTITPAPQVTVNAPAASSTSACAYADQAAVNAAFATWLGGFTVSGGCNPQGSYGEVSAPNACGGTTTVTYTVMDKCYQTTTVTRSFTITPAPALMLSSPDSTIINSCDYIDQAAVNAAFATWLSQFGVTGGCNPQGSYGEPMAPQLCSGGTTTVTYAVIDKCNKTDVTETFTVVPAETLTVSCPANRVVECGETPSTAFEQWKDGFSYSGGCANVTVTDLTQYQMPEPGVELVITYTVSDNCQSASCTARFFINPCAFCSYTQGYYGNVRGTACTPEGNASNAKTIMTNALNNVGGIYNFGSTITGNYFALTLNDITSDNIFKMMPGGGTPRALIGFATYSNLLTWSDNDPLRATGPQNQRGRINNNLLSQTMTLFFNLQLNGEGLSDFGLTNTFVTADTETCGSHTPVSGTEQLFNISPNVINYLDNNGGATVGNLFVLANKVLGGIDVNGISASDVNAAVDAINRGFDECRVFVGTSMPVVESRIKESIEVKVYPNPYTENFNLNVTTTNNSKVSVSIYDMIGRLIETREINPSETKEIKVGDKYPSGVYNVIVSQGVEVKTLRVIKR